MSQSLILSQISIIADAHRPPPLSPHCLYRNCPSLSLSHSVSLTAPVRHQPTATSPPAQNRGPAPASRDRGHISLFTVASSQSVEARRALRLERIGEASSYSLRMAARPWETRLLEQATSNSSKPCTAKVRKNNVTKRISTKPPEAVLKFL
nr:protein IQ-DOMAIN 1 isoform X1 [Ipomoea batatas]